MTTTTLTVEVAGRSVSSTSLFLLYVYYIQKNSFLKGEILNISVRHHTWTNEESVFWGSPQIGVAFFYFSYLNEGF
jgi:hypothetical protein